MGPDDFFSQAALGAAFFTCQYMSAPLEVNP